MTTRVTPTTRLTTPRVAVPGAVNVALFLAFFTFDGLRRISIGGTTAIGVVTILSGLLIIFMVLGHFVPRRQAIRGMREPPLRDHGWLPVGYLLFLIWTYVSFALHGADSQGFQNLFVYTIFFGSIVLVSSQSSAGTAAVVIRRFNVLGMLMTVAFLVSLLLTNDSKFGLYSSRSFGLLALIFLAVSVPLPRGTGGRLAQYAPWMYGLAVLLSLSRTASVAAIVMLAGRVVRGRRRGRAIRALAMLGIAVAAGTVAVQKIPAVHNRVFGGDQHHFSNGLVLNTEGRTVIWNAVIAQIKTSPWLGHGVGAAADLIHQILPSDAQPHSDYLRFIDDLGFLGLIFWVLGTLVLLSQCYKRARARTGFAATIHYGAVLGLLGISVGMSTDNVVIYPFAMAPLGVIVGASLAYPIRPTPEELASERASETGSEKAEDVPSTGPRARRRPGRTPARRPARTPARSPARVTRVARL